MKSSKADIEKWREVFGGWHPADFITVDGWVGAPARERVSRALDDKLLIYDERTSQIQSDEQYTALCYRPTDKMRELL